MVYYDFLNIVFAPILKLPLIVAIIIISLLFTVINLLITKFFSDQSKMKRIREDTQRLNVEMKELRKDPTKVDLMQKKMAEMSKLSMEQLRLGLKPMLISFIIFVPLVIPWMSSVFAYESIHPQQPFTVTASFVNGVDGNATLIVPEGIKLSGDSTKKIENNMVSWSLKGEEGTHTLEFEHDGEKKYKDVLITNTKKYLSASDVYKNSAFSSIKINYNKLIVVPVGIKDWFGWLGTYIILSIIFAMTLRKLFKIY